MTFTVTMYPAAPSEAAMTRSQAQRPRPDSRGQYFQPWRLRREETNKQTVSKTKTLRPHLVSAQKSPKLSAGDPRQRQQQQHGPPPPPSSSSWSSSTSADPTLPLSGFLGGGGGNIVARTTARLPVVD